MRSGKVVALKKRRSSHIMTIQQSSLTDVVELALLGIQTIGSFDATRLSSHKLHFLAVLMAFFYNQIINLGGFD